MIYNNYLNCFSDDPPPYIDGIRINSPHYLCKIILSPGARRYTLVVSQYEKTQTIYYTLRAYATCPFSLTKIEDRYNSVKEVRFWSNSSSLIILKLPRFQVNGKVYWLEAVEIIPLHIRIILDFV